VRVSRTVLWEGEGEIPLPDPITYTQGLATFLMLKWEKEKARQAFQHIVQLQQWGAFGFIATVVKMKRW